MLTWEPKSHFERSSAMHNVSAPKTRSLRPTPLTAIWHCLTVSCVVLCILFALKYGNWIKEPAVTDPRWLVTAQGRRIQNLLASSASATLAVILAFATAYSTGKKRKPVLYSTLFCILAAVTFLLDSQDLLYHPWGLEVHAHVLICAAGITVYSLYTSLANVYFNDTFANTLRTHYPLYVTIFGWPLPRYVMQLWPHAARWPLAACIALVNWALFLYLTAAVAPQITNWLPMARHSIILLLLWAMVISWALSDIVYIAIGAGVQVSADVALALIYASILVAMIRATVILFQGILAYEESGRFKAERDVAQAELATRIRQQELATQAEEARQKFLRYVFHELRVPFNSLEMGLGMILEDVESAVKAEKEGVAEPWRGARGVLISEDAHNTLEIMGRAAASMKVIINDTLDWTKLQSGAFQISLAPAHFADVVASTILGLTNFALHPDNRVQVVHEIDSDIPEWLLADKVRLQQVVANFLSNAIKFAPKDGTGVVTVRVEACSLPHGPAEGKPSLLSGGPIWWKEAPGPDLLSSHASGTALSFGGATRLHVPLTPELQPRSLLSFRRQSSAHARSPGITDGNNLPAGLCTPYLPKDVAAKLDSAGFSLAPLLPGDEGVSACTLLMSVRDNGEGIAADDIPSLFRAFRQLDAGMQYKGKGTGLGLAICHEIVSLHGGRVGVRKSTGPGAGAEFLVALRLPILHHSRYHESAHLHSSVPSSVPSPSDQQRPCSTAGGALQSAMGMASHTVETRASTAEGARLHSAGTRPGAAYIDPHSPSSTVLTGDGVLGGLHSRRSSWREYGMGSSTPRDSTSSLAGGMRGTSANLHDNMLQRAHAAAAARTEGGHPHAGVRALGSIPMNTRSSSGRLFNADGRDAGSRKGSPKAGYAGGFGAESQAAAASTTRAGRSHVSTSHLALTLHVDASATGPLAITEKDRSCLHARTEQTQPIEQLPGSVAECSQTVQVRQPHELVRGGHEDRLAQAPGQRTLRILVVDDVADSRKLLQRTLRRHIEGQLARACAGSNTWRVEIDEAEDGHIAVQRVTGKRVQGLEGVRRGSACYLSSEAEMEPQHYDAITMDAEMPILSGFEATRLLRQAGFKGCILGCTGNALTADQELFVRSGVGAVFIKPLDVKAVSSAIVGSVLGV